MVFFMRKKSRTRRKAKHSRWRQTSRLRQASGIDPAFLPVSVEVQERIQAALAEVGEAWPGAEGRLQRLVAELVERQLSTRAVEYLEELYDRLPDAGLRAMVARRAYRLRREYMVSFKEFSDRALIQLAKRSDRAAQWEGLYLLGTYGGQGALQFLQEGLENGFEPALAQAARVAIRKIHLRLEEKRRERGF